MDGETKDVNDASTDSSISPMAAGELRKIIAAKKSVSKEDKPSG